MVKIFIPYMNNTVNHADYLSTLCKLQSCIFLCFLSPLPTLCPALTQNYYVFYETFPWRYKALREISEIIFTTVTHFSRWQNRNFNNSSKMIRLKILIKVTRSRHNSAQIQNLFPSSSQSCRCIPFSTGILVFEVSWHSFICI